MKTPAPIKKALQALELRDGLQKIRDARKAKVRKEHYANYAGEIARLHGQAGTLPGLQEYVAQRRALAQAIAKKINKG